VIFSGLLNFLLQDQAAMLTHIKACAAVHGQSANWYNAALQEMAQLRRQDAALELLAEMQKSGIEPNDVTCVISRSFLAFFVTNDRERYRLFLQLGDSFVASAKSASRPSHDEQAKKWWISKKPAARASSPAAAHTASQQLRDAASQTQQRAGTVDAGSLE
jgi:pentatricopeptide repeat protein